MAYLGPELAGAPPELVASVQEFWPSDEWANALNIAWLESYWDAFANHDSTSADAPCGSVIGETAAGVKISAEHSIGYFQINVCNFPDWVPERLWNARENAGTAHALWDASGWAPWYFSARTLGLL